jgi:MFS family permease
MVGQGAVIPVLPLYATELGASLALAGVLAGTRGLGTMLADLPAGIWVARFGERRVMLAAAIVLSLVGLGVSLRPPLPVFGGLVLLMGAAWAVFNVARINYLTDAVPIESRGRIMSTLGATQRAGLVIGPLLGGLAIAWFGLAGSFHLQALMGLAAVTCLFIWMEPSDGMTAEPKPQQRLPEIARTHRRTFLTAGLAVAALQVVRSARDVGLPLWAELHGMTPAQVSTLFAAMFALDMAVFYPVGVALDRIGRRAVFISSTLLMSVGLAALAFATSTTAIVTVGLLTGLGNGMSSGINLTISSDFAPSLGRAEFLGMFRLVTDVGTGAGPVLIGVTAALSGLAAALMTAALTGLLGLAWFVKTVPETLDVTGQRGSHRRHRGFAR